MKNAGGDEEAARDSLLYELRGVRQQYGEVVVLDIPALGFTAGGVTALLGPNGAGKTTLLRLLAGLDVPSRGAVAFHGTGLGSTPARAALRRRVTFVHQQPYLFHASVGANVGYGLKQRGIRGRVLGARVEQALRRVDLDGLAQRRAQGLSAGEGQRVALARALALEPEVLLLDEPTAHADRDTFTVIKQVIAQAAELGATVILASHDHELVAGLARRRLEMAYGRLVATAEGLLAHPSAPRG
ncbi:MAG: ATP-binding cassette domain-containing protein [Candidatus Tectomicrobia bacterium]|nr:ATP-binding cassette domain-containing protein [Candidatus Tectomicrobia bacterium]